VQGIIYCKDFMFARGYTASLIYCALSGHGELTRTNTVHITPKT
jgi:hypothetical protein